MILTELSIFLLMGVVSLCIIWYGARRGRKVEGKDYDYQTILMLSLTWYIVLPVGLTNEYSMI